MKVLIFGDETAKEYIEGAYVSRHPDIGTGGEFWYQFSQALDSDLYDKVYVCTGENMGKMETQRHHRMIKDYINCVIIGPHGDIDTLKMDIVNLV